MNTALLTIDDFSSANTPAIVDYLVEKGIQPIFFATGRNVEQFYDEALYAMRRGMLVGNHSYTHAHFSELTLEEAIGEIEQCEQVLDRLYRDAGVERLWRPFRFPYGDKGGENREGIQQYLKEKGFHKVKDTHFNYPWWKESGLDTAIDTLWTFDFQEYMLRPGSSFTKENIWQKMHNPAPETGAALFSPENRHILLLHAHDETDEMLPGYYKLLIDHLLENGIAFDRPEFL